MRLIAPNRREIAMDDEWLTTEELAARHKVEPRTVAYWRERGTGPKGTKFGKHVKYRLSNVIAWEKAKEAAEETARVTA
jgi:phage terminase Nu1 subunit (DNA packaging protein)